MPLKREKLKTGKEESLYGLYFRMERFFQAWRTELKKKPAEQGKVIAVNISGKAARWIIVGHKTSEICKSQSQIQESISWAGGHQGFLVMRGIQNPCILPSSALHLGSETGKCSDLLFIQNNTKSFLQPL